MKDIKWAIIDGFEMYEVSNYGHIRTKFRNNRLADKVNQTKATKINKDGYLEIQLYNLELKKTKTIHRLVAKAFCDNPKNLDIVNHLDGDKKNNYYKNLEWCTIQHNTQHAYDNNLININNMRGAKHPQSKIKNTDVPIIRKLYFEDMQGQISISKKYNVSKNLISAIVTGRTWEYIEPDKLSEYLKINRTKRKN